MSEMVERGARALASRAGVDPDDLSGGTWDGGSYSRGKPAWTAWEDDARAAIEAMREPTEAMVALGFGLHGTVDRSESDGPTKDLWQAMIDEALKG